MSRAASVPARCDGCLGSTSCWVCLGTGRTTTNGRAASCARCRGTGRCSMCQEPEPQQLARARRTYPQQREPRTGAGAGEMHRLASYSSVIDTHRALRGPRPR